MKTFSRALFVFSAASIGALANGKMSDGDSCAPIRANVHDKLRCRQVKDLEKKLYEFDNDCCGGAAYSNAPARCANGFTRTETRSCAHGHPWCDANGCKEYTCKQSASCVELVGCFTDEKGDPALPFKAIDFPPGARYADGDRVFGIVSDCSNYCRKKNFTFAAVQGADTCWCGDSNSYSKHGAADQRLCEVDRIAGVARRCGDGKASSCLGVNAVYRLKGTEFCCGYENPARPEERDTPRVAMYYFLIGPIVAAVCALFWTIAPCTIGACIWCSMKKKRAAASATMTTTHVTTATPQPPTNAVMVNVMDPATQKSDVVVAESVANPTQPNM